MTGQRRHRRVGFAVRIATILVTVLAGLTVGVATSPSALAASRGCSAMPTPAGGNLCVLGRGSPVWNQSAGSVASPAIDVAGDIFINGPVTSSGGTRAGGQIGMTGPSAPANWRPTPQTNQPAQDDPFADRPFEGACGAPVTPNGGTGTRTLDPGTYSSLSVSKGNTLTLRPGVYTLTGDMSNGGGTIIGTGVTFYFCGSAKLNLSSNNDGITTLTAPGGASGLLFFFDRANTGDALDFGNNNTGLHADLTGLIYAPNARMYSTGGNSASIFNITGDLVVGRIYWSGAHKLNIRAGPPPPPQADVRITKAAPQVVAPDGEIEYTISVVNTGASAAEDVTVTDVLSPHVDLNGISLPSECRLDVRTVTCELGTLGPGEPRVLSYTVRPLPGTDSGTNIENCGTVSSTTPQASEEDKESCTTTTVEENKTNISITKRGTTSVLPGGTVSYTLTVTNHGPATAEDVVVHDFLPAELTGVSTPNGCSLSGRELTCDIGTLAVDVPRVFTVTGTVAPETPPTTAFQNCASVETSTPETTYDDNKECVDTTVEQPPTNVSITKTGTTSVLPGGSVSYTLTVTNHGPVTAEDVMVHDLLPAELTGVSPPSGCMLSGRELTCDIGTLGAGASRVFIVTGTVAPETAPTTAFQNCALVETSTPETDYRDNHDCVETTVGPPPPAAADVGITKTGTTSVLPGGSVSYTLTVTNHGPGTAEGVVVHDLLPAELTGVSPPSGCMLSGRVLTCDIGTLGAGASRVFLLTGTVAAGTAAGTAMENCAAVESSTPDTNPGNNSDCAKTTVRAPSADVGITKTGTTSVLPGGSVSYTLTVTNHGPDTAEGVVVHDVLPAQLTGLTAPSGCSLSGRVLTCDIGTLGAGASRVFIVTGTVAAGTSPTSFENCASVESTSSDTNPGNNSDCAETTVRAPSADVGITKTGTTSVLPGGSVSYTLTVTNHGPDTAEGVLVSDVLPAQLTGVSPPSGCSLSGRVLTCDIGTLGAGASRVFTVTGTVAAGTSPTSFENCASVESTSSDTNPGNNSDCVETTVRAPSADVGITKTGTTSVLPGGSVSYTLTVTNHGPDTAEGVVVHDVLPAQLTGLTAPSGCSLSGRELTCDIGTLGAGASRVFTVTGTVAAGTSPTSFENCASVESTSSDTNPGNNSDCAETTVRAPSADVGITKTGTTSVLPGGAVRYVLRVTNHGPDRAEGVLVSDVLPAQLTGVSPPSGCSLSGRVLTCDIGTLGAGASRVFIVTGTVAAGTAAGTAMENCAAVESTSSDTNPGNNHYCAETTVRAPSADVGITKTGTASVLPDGSVSYTLTVTNHGPDTAEGVVVHDVLPAQLTGLTAPSGCSLSGRVLTCDIGTLGAGASRVFIVTGTVAAGTSPTSFENCASVESTSSDTNPGNNHDCAKTTVRAPSADVGITKTGTTSVLPGGAVRYVLRVTNHGPDTAEGVLVSDVLPAQLTGVSPPAGCSLSGRVLTCDIGTLGAGASRVFIVTGTVAAGTSPTSFENCAAVESTSSDTNPGNNHYCVETTVRAPSADVGITKTGTASVLPGGAVRYVLRVTNHGPDTAEGVLVSDVLPAQLTGVSPPAGCSLSGRVLTCDIGTLGAGASRVFIVTGTVAAGTAAGTAMENCAAVESTSSDTNPGNNSDCAETTVRAPSADVGITKTGTTSVLPDGTVSYTLTVTNHGPDTAEGVLVSDMLPAQLTGLTAPSGCSLSGRELTCDIGTLGVGASRVFIVTGTVAAGTMAGSVIENCAAVESTSSDTNPGNNSDCAHTTAVPGPVTDVAITKTGPATAAPGERITYTLTVTNLSRVTAHGVFVSDALPDDVTVTGVPAGCVLAGPAVTCTVGQLPPGATRTFTITATVRQVPAGSAIGNCAAVYTTTPETNVANNASCVQTLIPKPPVPPGPPVPSPTTPVPAPPVPAPPVPAPTAPVTPPTTTVPPTSVPPAAPSPPLAPPVPVTG